MAERRMFAKTIIDSDAFLDMPLSAQALYFHLSMRADDDGFINNPKKIQRMIGASDDDARLLIAKQFIIPFETGVVVIKHWKIHNYIRNDRYKATIYTNEKALLVTEKSGEYSLGIPSVYQTDTVGIPDGYQMDTQDRIVKYSVVKSKDVMPVSDEPDEIPTKQKSNNKEMYDEVVSYLNEKAGTNYRSSTPKTQSLIRARVSEGFTVEDFKVVIDKKCTEWTWTDMEKYLRPETLFGSKFESYLNAKATKKQPAATGITHGDQDDLDELF